LDDFETIVGGEKPHAADAGTVHDLFALVHVGVDPLVHWVLLSNPGGGWFGAGDGSCGGFFDIGDGHVQHDAFSWELNETRFDYVSM
jgi:hypothetical protein